jgi:RimK family alpha-L-glutamate ligase
MLNKNIKIALFYGGKISRHLVMIREAARKLGVDLKLISYNMVSFETETGKVSLRGEEINKFDVVFFRTTGKHWEEVDLVTDWILKSKNRPIIVDPLVMNGKPSYACKAWQMLKLKEAGIPVPKTIYGSLWYLYEVMKDLSKTSQDIFVGAHTSVRHAAAVRPKNITALFFDFPVILKGSGGDRGTRVYKADNLGELEKLVRDLRKSETEEGRRYMLQEYIENKGDYRVLILGEKVLGVMKRFRKNRKDFRNNFSMGGEVEVAELPVEIKKMAVEAAKVCGLMVAGVDVMPKNNDTELSNKRKDYVVLEVNKGPQFRGFMKATGIDVPAEIVKFLVSLVK